MVLYMYVKLTYYLADLLYMLVYIVYSSSE